MAGGTAWPRVGGGVNDEDTTHWSFAVVSHQSTGRDHIYIISLGLIEMDAVSTVEFGARAHSVSAVKGMDYEQHWLCPDCAVDYVTQGIMYAGRRRFLDIELAVAEITFNDLVLGTV